MDVSEWLKFVEAKHAGLFAVWTALMIAIISNNHLGDKITVGKAIIFIVVIIGIAINALSFMPFLNRCKGIKRFCYNKYAKQLIDGNLIFYQEIFVATYSDNIQDSLKKYEKAFEDKELQLQDNKLAMDYLKQIIEVSTVGTIKVFLFNIAVRYIMTILFLSVCFIVVA